MKTQQPTQRFALYRRMRGFSLIEVLVVIGVIGILIALILPAVQRARESARTLQCRNNLYQVGLEMHNYHETHLVFPPGMFNYLGDDIDHIVQPDGTTGLQGPTRSCWMQQILPFLDQGNLHAQLPFDSNVEAHLWGKQFGTPIWTVVPTLMCPSDPANPKVKTDREPTVETSEGFHGNVVMCAGSTDFGLSGQARVTGEVTGDDLNGLFYALSSTSLADVTDGTSNTVMGSELILNPDGQDTATVDGPRDTRGRYYNSYRGNALFSTQYPPNTSIPDEVSSCEVPNPASPCQTGADVIVQYARSYHPGGVNAMLADGSVRFLSENMSTNIFRALGTRAGGESLGEF